MRVMALAFFFKKVSRAKPAYRRQAAMAQRKGFPPISNGIKVWSSRERAVNSGLLSVDDSLRSAEFFQRICVRLFLRSAAVFH
jgi:hypothetical protein